jgi:hypothetical protein
VKDDVRPAAVLILSADPLPAALLGSAVELSGQVPHFPQPGESARLALMRVRPRLALIDCDHVEACSDGFAGPALMTGAKLLLFRSRHATHDASALAERLGVTILEMPAEHAVLIDQLRAMLSE